MVYIYHVFYNIAAAIYEPQKHMVRGVRGDYVIRSTYGLYVQY